MIVSEDRRRELTVLAESIVATSNISLPPVDPNIWIGGQEVRLIRKDLRGSCDGLIRFKGGRFYIFWNPEGPRAVFSLAHEVAHYLIPEHNQVLRTGKGEHNSISDFRSTDSIEREADIFASRILMPRSLFLETELTFKNVIKRSEEFQVSLTSCMIRLIEESRMAVAGVLTYRGKMLWCSASEEMVALGMHNASFKAGSPPAGSKTAELVSRLPESPFISESAAKPIPFEQWFRPPFDTERELWEEALPIKKYDSVLTLLTYEGQGD